MPAENRLLNYFGLEYCEFLRKSFAQEEENLKLIRPIFALFILILGSLNLFHLRAFIVVISLGI